VNSYTVQSAYNSTNGYVYVTNGIEGSVSVINPANNSVVATISIPNSDPTAIVVGANGNVYVSGQTSGSIYVINPTTNTIASTINMYSFDSTKINAGAPVEMTYNTANGNIYGTYEGNVEVINPTTDKLVADVLNVTTGTPQGGAT